MVFLQFGGAASCTHNEFPGVSMKDAILRFLKRLDINTRLCDAVYSGDIALVDSLIARGAGVNSLASLSFSSGDMDKLPSGLSRKTSPLHFAVMSGRFEMIQHLLSSGADVNCPRNLFVDACMWGETGDTLRLLLRFGADVEALSCRGYSALISLSGRNDNLEKVRLLLEYGVDVNAKDSRGNTALMEAVSQRRIPIAKALLLYGANVNLQCADVRTRDGCEELTPIMRAVIGKSSELVDLLLDHGADVNGQCGSENMTPLMRAVIGGSSELVELLLLRGADPNIENRGGGEHHGKTALSVALTMRNARIVQLLKWVRAST